MITHQYSINFSLLFYSKNGVSAVLRKIVLGLIVIATSQFVQAQIFSVDSLNILNSENDQVRLKLPLLIGPDPITESINKQVFEGFLFDSISSPFRQNIEALIQDEEKFGIWYENVDYQVIFLSDTFYSVEIYGQGCGAYCDDFYYSFLFDLETGFLVESTDIFSVKGYDIFQSMVIRSKNKTLEDEIKKLISQSENLEGFQEEQEYVLTMTLYATCLDVNSEAFHGYISVDKKKLYIHLDRCSNHAERALDELGEFVFVYELSEIEEYLSPYGKTLLLN